MAPMQWSPMFETGVKEIDDQHRQLVSIIDRMHSAADEDLIRHVLEAAIDYTLYHFAFEECLLESHNYPLLDAHKKVHDRFAADLNQLKHRFEQRELSAQELTEKLTAWIFDHVRNADTAAMRKPIRK